MSMICRLLGLSPAQIVAVRATPTLTSDIVAAFESGDIGNLVDPDFRAALLRRGSAPPPTPHLAQVEAIAPFEPALNLEKSWHMLHYLFSGHAWVTGAPGEWLLTGQDLGNDVGYGPPRLQDEAQTVAFHEFIGRLDSDRLVERVNFSGNDQSTNIRDAGGTGTRDRIPERPRP